MEFDLIPPFWQDFLANIRHVVLFPFHAGERIFWLYLITSALIAFLVYLRLRRARSESYS